MAESLFGQGLYPLGWLGLVPKLGLLSFVVAMWVEQGPLDRAAGGWASESRVPGLLDSNKIL